MVLLLHETGTAHFHPHLDLPVILAASLLLVVAAGLGWSYWKARR